MLVIGKNFEELPLQFRVVLSGISSSLLLLHFVSFIVEYIGPITCLLDVHGRFLKFIG
jgi:hypothetical protein